MKRGNFLLKKIGLMTSQIGWLECYPTNVSKMKVMFSTYMPGGRILACCLNRNIFFKKLYGIISKIGYSKMILPKFINIDRVY